jgi:hypothetical protein
MSNKAASRSGSGCSCRSGPEGQNTTVRCAQHLFSCGPLEFDAPALRFRIQIVSAEKTDYGFMALLRPNPGDLPSRGKWKMQIRIRACAAILMAMISLSYEAASAQQTSEKIFYAIRIGVLAHDVDHLWSRSRAEGGVDMNAELVFNQPGFSLLGGRVLPNIGASLNSRKDTSKIYGGLLWEFLIGSAFFANSGMGICVHDGDLDSTNENRKQLGSRLLFRIPFEIGVALGEHHRLSLMFDHVSNAYLASPNEGLDTLGIRYGFQF